MAVKLKRDLLVKNLIQNHQLVPHLDKAIAEGELEWSAKFEGKVSDDAWHPSGDCIPSPYDLYHGVDQPKPALTASQLKTFAVGHFWHQYIQYVTVVRLGFATWDAVERKGLKAWGYEETTGTAVPKPYHWAAGSGDIAPCTIPGSGDFLVDIKTMGLHDFRQNGLPSWCAGKYEAQINIYMDFFDLERAMILCVAKDSPHDMKEFIFERNQPLIDAIYYKWKLVGECLSEKVEPPADFEVSLPLKGPR